MIWTRGEVVPEEALRIGVRDRTFEHGLGLFETLRTWNGHPTLMDRHRERMIRSAAQLGLALDPSDFPDERAVHQLRTAIGPAAVGDVRLRITLSGGSPSDGGRAGPGTLWMTAGPLPTSRGEGARILRSALADRDDPLSRHKTLNYWRRRIALERAAADGSDEVLYLESNGRLCEGGRSNLFLVEDRVLVTPASDGPLLEGVMRGVVLEWAWGEGIPAREGAIDVGAIGSCSEAFLTNSVRGIVPVSRLLNADLPAPGPIAVRLWDRIRPWLESGGTTP